jgi:hypothetical protein
LGEAFHRLGIAEARARASMMSSVTVVSRCWPSITSSGDWLET